MKNFVEQISIKFGGLYLIKMNLVETILKTILVQNCAEDKHTKISIKIRISAEIQSYPSKKEGRLPHASWEVRTMVFSQPLNGEVSCDKWAFLLFEYIYSLFRIISKQK